MQEKIKDFWFGDDFLYVGCVSVVGRICDAKNIHCQYINIDFTIYHQSVINCKCRSVLISLYSNDYFAIREQRTLT